MPVKRRGSKLRDWRITPEAVAAFEVAMRTLATFSACRRETTCPMGMDCGDNCQTCLDHLDARTRLNLALRVRPWQESPIDATGERFPEYYGEERREFWAKAMEQRRELERAAGMKRETYR